MSASQIAAGVRAKKLSATEVVTAALDRIAAGGALNAFTDVTADRALAEAEAVDAKVGAGADPGPLAGVPFAVKNLFDLKGLTTRAGSKIQRDQPTAGEDAVVVARLVKAGAACVGALNMGEYAYDFTGENIHESPSRNPHDLTRMSGGSSGGSGSAVGGRLVPLALGSDTNGSIRVPSSFCGLFGLKPTYGRLPRTGTFPFVDSLDHVGPLARTAEDLVFAYDAMQGPDGGDPGCTAEGVETVTPVAPDRPLRVARLEGYFRGQGDTRADEAADRIAVALGAGPSATLTAVGEARASAFIITMIEAAALHQERLATRADDFEPMVRDRLLAGALIPGIHYVKAQRVRRAFLAQVRSVWPEVPVVFLSIKPSPARWSHWPE
ncbi:MAG: AtzE family amidohydrolase, partial [Pseudomonadota bacterium]